MLEFCLIKSTGFWNVLDTNNTQFVSSFPHFYLANEIKNSVQKNYVFNLPGISYSRNRTSRSLQECVLVCLVEWPNSVAISIDIVAKCPVILSPFWIDLDWTQKEKTIISMHWRRLRWCFDSMERLVMRRTRRFDCTHTLCTNWWFRLNWQFFVSFIVLYVFMKKRHEPTRDVSLIAWYVRLYGRDVRYMWVFSRWFHCHYWNKSKRNKHKY